VDLLKKQKILVVADGIWSPAVKMRGIKAIWEIQKHLSQKKDVEIHILTILVPYWTSDNYLSWFKTNEKRTGIKFHSFCLPAIYKISKKASFYLERLLIILSVLRICNKEKIDIIHEYSSSSLLFFRSYFYKFFYPKARIYHTLITSSKNSFFMKFSNSIDKIICSTIGMKNKFDGKIGKNKTQLIFLGIKNELFKKKKNKKLRNMLGIKNYEKVVLYIGPVEKRKGIFTFANSIDNTLKNYTNVKFIFIINDSPSEEDKEKNFKLFNKIIEKFGEKTIVINDIVNISKYMAASDIVVIPQITSYGILGYPLTMLEAMSSGNIVIASNIEPLNELVENKKNGFLFRIGNSKDLSIKILDALKNYEKYETIIKNARATTEKFDIKKIADQLHDLYFSW